ncbi:hypothetical protein [Dendrosporobacter sp. 1207_IL3150]|uniref:hypothetical protein n=1 Tax=Dendrosporobacter sp. 1207_IL3150 TaxID=3084054 RepID=UPI002FDA8734
MYSNKLRLLVCLTLICLLAGFTSTALAAPSLQWYTDQVYYDNLGRLIIDGYFYNSGTRIIKWVNWLEMNIYVRQHSTRWWLQESATFRDLNVTLYPGESIRWKFRIHNVDYAYFDYWDVKWRVNYQYQ